MPTWPCSPRTKVKLEILSSYLGAWFSILAHGFERATYVDGFCGPGRYSTGEDGSPVVALKHAIATIQRFPRFTAQLVFIDENQQAIEHLKSLGITRASHRNVEIEFINARFADALPIIHHRFPFAPKVPMFSFIDPFGFSDTPFASVRSLMPNQHSELFVNLMGGWANRFCDHPHVGSHVDEQLGGNFRERIRTSSDGVEEVMRIYEEQLGTLASFVRRFQMRDDTNVRDNALIFCGKHARGYEKMKEAMWKLDPLQGNSFSVYRASRSQGIHDLFGGEPFTAPLRNEIVKAFGKVKNVTVAELMKCVVERTDYLPKHLRTELDNLERSGEISFRDPLSTAPRRGWPERLLISFRE